MKGVLTQARALASKIETSLLKRRVNAAEQALGPSLKAAGRTDGNFIASIDALASEVVPRRRAPPQGDRDHATGGAPGRHHAGLAGLRAGLAGHDQRRERAGRHALMRAASKPRTARAQVARAVLAPRRPHSIPKTRRAIMNAVTLIDVTDVLPNTALSDDELLARMRVGSRAAGDVLYQSRGAIASSMSSPS